jgi:hypothetical protein
MKTPRNLAARSPLMRKGGVHQRTRSSARFAGRQALQHVLDEQNDEANDGSRSRRR